MRRAIIVLAVVVWLASFAVFAEASQAQAVQTISVANHANVSAKVLRLVKQATLREVNGPLHRYWHTPKIKFGPGGWQLKLVPQLYGLAWDQGGCAPDGGAQGCHAYWTEGSLTGQPFMTVATFSQRWNGSALTIPPQWTQGFAHEIIEALTDEMPGNEVGEVCDETGDSSYQVTSGVQLPDFDMPNGKVAPEIN